MEKHVPFTSFRKESPVPGLGHGDICVTILNFGDEHQRMELVSNGTRSSFDGPLSAWKFLKVCSK